MPQEHAHSPAVDTEWPAAQNSGDGQPSVAPNGLSAQQLSQFARDGYLILRSVVPSAECSRLLSERIKPALARAGVDPFDDSTWKSDGTVIRAADGGDHPIPLSCPDARWAALFDSPYLSSILSQLHGGAHRWAWAYGAAEGLGWIHVRFPVQVGRAWVAPVSGWHIDGESATLDTSASVVLLPMLTTIRPGGGGTALLRGSHHRHAPQRIQLSRARPHAPLPPFTAPASASSFYRNIPSSHLYHRPTIAHTRACIHT